VHAPDGTCFAVRIALLAGADRVAVSVCLELESALVREELPGAILEYLGLAARPPPLTSPRRAAGARLFDPDSDRSRD